MFQRRATAEFIEVRGARENNLREIDLDIPKRQLTVFTGVSGSGKSSLVFGTIAAESRRLINETYDAFVQGLMPHAPQPDVDALRHMTAAIIVGQEQMGANSRSTVGTATDTYTMLRLLFARAGTPRVASPNVFGFNDPRGMCPACEGLGRVTAVDPDALVDMSKSLNDGAIDFPHFKVGSWQWKLYAETGLFDPDLPLRDYAEADLHELLYGKERKINTGSVNLTYQGLITRLRTGLLQDRDSMQPAQRAAVERVATQQICDECGGARLNATARAVRLGGRSIADCVDMQVDELAEFLAGLDLPAGTAPLSAVLLHALKTFAEIGLGYLNLNRPTSTLSGGEAQRTRMVKHLGSALTDVTYVFDEPTTGLHPHDVERMNHLLQQLRDKGNTVLVVEHKPEVMAIADHIIDMGPGAGIHGGDVVYAGDIAGLRRSGTRTGAHLEQRQALKTHTRVPTGWLPIRGAAVTNLRHVDIDVPLGVLVAVTGVAGSGKSSLIHGCLPREQAAFVDQSAIRGSRRSSPITYTGILNPIRKAFAQATGAPAALFSANSQGACPECKGQGVIYTDLAFMAGVESVCETCYGKRFTDEALSHRLRGRTIAEIYEFSVEEASDFFSETSVLPMLHRLRRVGLDYLGLGQRLTTLSGGERQRLKLAIEMAADADILVLDEPTSGLHMADTDRLVALLDEIVGTGRTVIVIEHNLDVISRADWIIDVGPGAGHQGGRIVHSGTPRELLTARDSRTAEHLARYHRSSSDVEGLTV
ncbi:daunorubicin resistance protein DrrC [Prauserella marina]|uniref:UvrABC system protein A n=1 Tax=Prauserella marina TaxID=530584 RepID=A0A222VLR3_9PSEU|nr:excinuclease ABC subunit UvrA [Prauserella marina]ASR34866.1 daunorubicin resistance protein DrrC [Prauserella marina]PWV85435.1 excinuclease ABC A subunit [Prauserella marina]SDC54878.1 excinuclease ABC, A subunit [Prauserella marina]